MRPAALAATGSLLLSLVLPAAAWDKDGHEAVGMTTMSALAQNATAEVKHLMGGRDAVDIAAWAHKVNKKHPWSVALHFQAQQELHCKGGSDLSCPDNKCLVKALKYFYGRLIHKEFAPITWPNGLHLTDADCVKYLVNLIGDLHQPLHLGLAKDDMGRNLTVEFRGKKTSLFDFWDKELVQLTIKGSPGFWWGGWTHVSRSNVQFDADWANWQKDGVVSFDKWAEETSAFLCDSVYTNRITGRSLLEEAKDGVVHVSEAMYDAWQRDMLSKILTAGARVAIVLNAVLHNRDESKALHTGSAIKDLEDDPDSHAAVASHVGLHSDSVHAARSGYVGPIAAVINLGIFSAVGFVFLQVVRLWQGTAVVAAANKAKFQDGGKGT